MTTADVSEASASVTVATTLRNTLGESKEVMLETVLYDATGNKVATARSEGPMAVDTATLKQTFTLEHPQLCVY